MSTGVSLNIKYNHISNQTWPQQISYDILDCMKTSTSLQSSTKEVNSRKVRPGLIFQIIDQLIPGDNIN